FFLKETLVERLADRTIKHSGEMVGIGEGIGKEKSSEFRRESRHDLGATDTHFDGARLQHVICLAFGTQFVSMEVTEGNSALGFFLDGLSKPFESPCGRSSDAHLMVDLNDNLVLCHCGW